MTFPWGLSTHQDTGLYETQGEMSEGTEQTGLSQAQSPGSCLGSQGNSALEPEKKEKGLGACPSCPSSSLLFQRGMTRCPCCLCSSSWQKAMLLSRVKETVCLSQLPRVGELQVAKALQREILKGSGLSSIDTVFRGWVPNNHVC